MAKQLSIGITSEQARAEVQQIQIYYDKIDELGKKAESAMLSICPLIANLMSTSGWLHLDNYSSVDGSHDTKTFGKWAEQYFDKPHSTMSETISVAKRFFNGNGELLNPEHCVYGYTQLLRMRKLTDDEIAENISPEMSSAEIKRIVVELKAPQKKIQQEAEEQKMEIPENLKNLMPDVEVPETENVSRETQDINHREEYKLSDFSDELQELFMQVFPDTARTVTIDMRA